MQRAQVDTRSTRHSDLFGKAPKSKQELCANDTQFIVGLRRERDKIPKSQKHFPLTVAFFPFSPLACTPVRAHPCTALSTLSHLSYTAILLLTYLEVRVFSAFFSTSSKTSDLSSGIKSHDSTLQRDYVRRGRPKREKLADRALAEYRVHLRDRGATWIPMAGLMAWLSWAKA
ncbi:hypothetical protein L1887_48172 [Cichorium endivia]|nr:hypothetical protein L1887_48172 [Cichorium endivia]